MTRTATRILMVAVIGVIIWGAAGKPSTRTTEDVPERVRGTWRLADSAAVPEGMVRAFRFEAARVVPLDPAGRELHAYPVVEVATTSGRQRIWGDRGPKLYFGPRIERIRVHFGGKHPTVVAEQRLDVEPLGEDRIRARHEYPFGPSEPVGDRWPDEASEYVRVPVPRQ
jgi:hypothetical protein